MPTRYRALVKGGYFSSTPFDKTIPVSIRCNNPGAVNGASWEKTYAGYVDTVETTPGNKTTIFEAPEYGVAVWWELLRRYANKGFTTVGEIINEYGGGQDYSNYTKFVTAQTGLKPGKQVDLADDKLLLAFGRAMFRYEAGRASPLSDDQILYGLSLGRVKGVAKDADPAPETSATLEMRTQAPAPTPLIGPLAKKDAAYTFETVDGVKAIQTALTRCGYLDPPADGALGPVTKWALGRFCETAGLPAEEGLSSNLVEALRTAEPLPLAPGQDLAGKIVRAMLRNKYWIAREPECLNIVYVEGMDPDGSSNDNGSNVFNDLRLVIRVNAAGVPEITGMWEATTEPSRKFTTSPMNADGAFHIKFGQYKAWIKGWYHTHDALIQAGEIEGYRDPHKTFKRDFNYPVKGEFGVHQHWGYDLPHKDMGNSSAGCLVGRSTQGHREFMELVLGDARYKANKTYRFMTAILPAGDLED